MGRGSRGSSGLGSLPGTEATVRGHGGCVLLGFLSPCFFHRFDLRRRRGLGGTAHRVSCPGTSVLLRVTHLRPRLQSQQGSPGWSCSATCWPRPHQPSPSVAPPEGGVPAVHSLSFLAADLGPEGGPQGLGRGRHQGWGVPQSPRDPAGTLTFRLAAPASLHLGTWLLPAPEPHAGPGKVLLGSSPPCPPTPRPSPPPTHTRGCVGPSGPSPGPLSGDVLLFTSKETEAGGLHQWLQTSASEQTTPPPRPGKGSDLGKRPL